MIRVKKGTVKVDGEKYIPGDIIYDLTEKEERKLISSKVAEPWGTASGVPGDEYESEKDEEDMQGSGAGEKLNQEPLSETDSKEDPETPKAKEPEKEKAKEAGIEPNGQLQIDNSGAADKIDIKFDAAAYVGETAPKKTKAGK